MSTVSSAAPFLVFLLVHIFPPSFYLDYFARTGNILSSRRATGKHLVRQSPVESFYGFIQMNERLGSPVEIRSFNRTRWDEMVEYDVIMQPRGSLFDIVAAAFTFLILFFTTFFDSFFDRKCSKKPKKSMSHPIIDSLQRRTKKS